MKKIIFLFLVGFTTTLSLFAQSVIEIPAGQSVQIDYPDFEAYAVELNTSGIYNISVAVVDKSNNEQIRGFGLGKLGKEKVMVEQGSMLVLENTNDNDVKVNFSVTPQNKSVFNKPKGKVSFTLRNSSNESIPLIIPTVMNPNLSPDSMSGVSLKMGQEIFFKAKGRKQILLVVDESIKKGDVIDVAVLLPKRKAELGIK